ncbi:MAG: fatty acid desaturase [Candidatus Zixiibacteriota bacterium]
MEKNRTPNIDRRELLKEMANYQQPTKWKSIWQLANTLIPYGVLYYAAYRSLDYSFLITLPLMILLAGFITRTFIIFHDCGHGSFFNSKRANSFWGNITGILTFTPFHYWRDSHNRHHATSGNLDKRGEGDIWMLTLEEYLEAPRMVRIKYRLYRNPIVMFLLGPLLITLVSNRYAGQGASRSDWLSVTFTNAAIAVIITLTVITLGWKAFLFIQLIPILIAHIGGVWLFYIQHQFEGVYWKRDYEWNFVNASLQGGSFYKLPAVLRWFSGSIGYHHVHHLNSRIPNYNLNRCQKNVKTLQITKPIGIGLSLKSMFFRLWDEENDKLISFREIKRRRYRSALD